MKIYIKTRNDENQLAYDELETQLGYCITSTALYDVEPDVFCLEIDSAKIPLDVEDAISLFIERMHDKYSVEAWMETI